MPPSERGETAERVSRRDVLRGAAAVGVGLPTGSAAAGTAAAQSTGTATQTGTGEGSGTGGGPGTAAPAGGTTHTVAMTDELVFDPDSLTIAPGDTVIWENVGNVGHSVTAYEDEVPEGASYWDSGGFDSESAARSGYPARGDVAGGEAYEHTFDVEGTYGYFCIPHESVGMLGEVVVRVGGAAEDGGPALSSVPDSAKTLAIATTTALISVVSLAYLFLKYGGDYEIGESGERGSR